MRAQRGIRGDITPDDVLEQARARTGLTEIDSDSWREGLEVHIAVAERSAAVTPEGFAFLASEYVSSLSNRLRVHQHVREHPEVLDGAIERPLVILGMPRTGTTVASYLLDQDPARRSLLNWEAVESVPPPTTATLRTDPRCLAKVEQRQARARSLEASGQGFPHWEEADGPTECIFVQQQDFKCLLWDSFSPNDAYYDWLVETDMTSTYQYEKRVLQVLQSEAPGTWSLKLPSHAVFIETLLATFPDARIIWAHRDPYQATASLCSTVLGGKRLVLGDNVDKQAIGRTSVKQMRHHVDRAARARQRVGDDQFYDLYYLRLLRDPIGEMRKIYEWAGDDLTLEVIGRMERWLAANPQDRFGRRTYSLEEYGLTHAELQTTFSEYLASFDIELEH